MHPKQILSGKTKNKKSPLNYFSPAHRTLCILTVFSKEDLDATEKCQIVSLFDEIPPTPSFGLQT